MNFSNVNEFVITDRQKCYQKAYLLWIAKDVEIKASLSRLPQPINSSQHSRALVNPPLLDLLQHGRRGRSLGRSRSGRRGQGRRTGWRRRREQPPAPSSAASTASAAAGAATSVRSARPVVAAVGRRWERRAAAAGFVVRCGCGGGAAAETATARRGEERCEWKR